MRHVQTKVKSHRPVSLAGFQLPAAAVDNRGDGLGKPEPVRKIMNMHVVGNADPLQVVAEEAWSFAVGQWVTHVDQPLPSLVVWRTRSVSMRADVATHEFYGLRSFLGDDQDRDRLMIGSSLKPMDEASWAVCLMRDVEVPPYLEAA